MVKESNPLVDDGSECGGRMRRDLSVVSTAVCYQNDDVFDFRCDQDGMDGPGFGNNLPEDFAVDTKRESEVLVCQQDIVESKN